MTELKIRKADENDIATIREIASVAFPATYREILSPKQVDYMMEWMYSAGSIRRQMEEGHVYYLAYRGEAPAGYVSVQQSEDDLFHLHKIYVHPDSQGLGCGVALFRKAIEHISEHHPGSCRMELNVNRHNKAFGFYRHMGMEVVDVVDLDIGNGYFMNDFIMALDIDPLPQPYE